VALTNASFPTWNKLTIAGDKKILGTNLFTARNQRFSTLAAVR
jgi:hypothetical protein